MDQGPDGDSTKPLRGVAARIVENMTTSLGVPTATSFHPVPAKLIEVNSKAQSRNLTHSIDLTHFRDDLRRRGAIDRNKRDRRASLFVTPKRESGNIDARVAEEAREAADEARLVLVGDIDHRRREFGVDLDPLDREDARFAVLKNGPANRPRLLRRLDGQRDEALIIAVRRAGQSAYGAVDVGRGDAVERELTLDRVG